MLLGTGLLALGLLTPGAHAQDAQDTSVDVELFQPHADAYGYMSVPSAATLGHLQVGTQFWANYSNDPLILVYEGQRVPPDAASVDGDDGDGVVDDRFLANAQIGMGLSRFFSFTVDVPLVLFQDGYQLANLDNPIQAPDPLTQSGVGDLRLTPKLVVIDRDRMPIGLAAAVQAGLPTGNGGSFLGEESFSLTPHVVGELSNGSIHARNYTFRSAVLAGYHVRSTARLRDVAVGNAITWGFAMGAHPAEPVEIELEVHGSVIGPSPAQEPAEALLGLKLLFGRYVSGTLGGGAGILPGVGSPDYRLVAGLSVAPSFDPNARDSDKDGIVDGMDRCVKEPEDLDEFQDEDGCPDPDNDVDNIPDDQDRCPNDPEDDDGWLDNDGCPEADNDKDGVLDIADRCPNEAESMNGFQDEDGCPDEAPLVDTDKDGYDDDIDRCPYDPEDFDEFQDEDGCPEPDNDNDGVPDAQDACPAVREVFNGVEDEDGCPDEGRVVLENTRIRILDKIYFDFNKATIQQRSFSLLDEIAALIVAKPELLKIRVEGHTDNVGGDLYNLKLSQDRADSVRKALMQRGVEGGRLEAVGFGEMRPIASNDTESGQSENRRVEFIIVDRE